MAPKYKIAIIANLTSFHERFNKENIKILISLGFEVFLYSNNVLHGLSSERFESFSEFCNLNKVNIVHIDIPRSPFKLLTLLKSYSKLYKQIEINEINYIHSHTPVGGLLARIISMVLSIPNIYTVHGYHFYYGSSILNWILFYPAEKLLSQFTNAIITINYEDLKFTNKHFRVKSYYLPGVGINTNSLHTKVLNQSNKIIKILSVGEINKNKNHEFVIKRLDRLPDLLRYSIAGSGPREAHLRKKIQDMNLQNRVKLHGYVDKVEDLLCETNIFVLPSIREGLPLSLMEAMVAGLPIVASDIRGIRDLIDHGKGGFLFDLGNPDSFDKAIEKLVTNRKLCIQMGKYNQDKIKQFDFHLVNQMMQKIYIEVFELSDYSGGK